jgi:hypothetical protein
MLRALEGRAGRGIGRGAGDLGDGGGRRTRDAEVMNVVTTCALCMLGVHVIKFPVYLQV